MLNTTIPVEEKINALQSWAKENNIPIKNLSKVISVIKTGSRGQRTSTDPMQFPDYYYPDESAKAWHDPIDYAWIKNVEAAYPKIKNEALSIFSNNLMSEHPQNNELANDGEWKTFFFYKNGKKYQKNLDKCPITASVINNIQGTSRAGRVYFSAMTAGTHVDPHCGPHNFKLRCHLGLVTTKEAVIRVSEEIKHWEDGKCIVFDDSFEHEVWNKSDITRIVLIIDVWNPCLTEEEIQALSFIGIPTA
ncbi:MAG: aspartyl/asparaginyl beta-hydroxylase domain-containing protein [Gammaproteobacteria bacterium]|nr:aspartyl/asparaginyl beta-hydroxylase domain-containing protein [Gammaproteobacteria bacterium]